MNTFDGMLGGILSGSGRNGVDRWRCIRCEHENREAKFCRCGAPFEWSQNAMLTKTAVDGRAQRK